MSHKRSAWPRTLRAAWRQLLLASLAACLGLACPLSIEPEDSGSSVIGAPCSDHADCAVGYCEKQVPGGYCLQICDLQPCPAGSRCVSFTTFPLPDLRLCQRTCTVDADCGRPGFVCRPAPDGGSLICNAVLEE